jgi:hypothetical protein
MYVLVLALYTVCDGLAWRLAFIHLSLSLLHTYYRDLILPLFCCETGIGRIGFPLL